MSKRTDSQANVDAEARAVAAGHHAWVQDDGSVKVISDTWGSEKFYSVTFKVDAAGLITFTCFPNGRNAFRDDHLYAETSKPGVVPCMHSALSARALMRYGLAQYDEYGRWVVTEKARVRAAEATPSEGLPQ